MKRVFERLWRFLFGDDVFVSYSRADGATYAAGLANELTARQFACKLDQWGSQPGREIPRALRAALRRSSMLVLVGSPGACASEQVGKEIVEFCRTSRAIVPIDIGGRLRSAAFWPNLEGLHISHDDEAALTTGDPNPAVVNRIEKTYTFTRRDRRLRSAAAVTTVLLVVLVVAAMIAAVIAAREAREALDQQRLARSRQFLAQAELARNQGDDPFVGSLGLAVEAWDAYQSNEPDAMLRFGLDRVPRLLADFAHPAAVVDVKLQPDGRLTTLCEDGQARVWRIGAAHPSASLSYDRSEQAFLSPDGRVVAIVKPRTAHVYRLVGDAFVQIGHVEHPSPIEDVVFDQTSTRLATASEDLVIKVTSLAGPMLEEVATIAPTSDGRLNTIRLSPDGNRVAIGTAVYDEDDDETSYPIGIWSVNPVEELMKTSGAMFEFNADGSRIATSRSDTWWVDDVTTGIENTAVARVVEDDAVRSYAFVDNFLITAGADASVRLYDLENDAKQLVSFDHNERVDRLWLPSEEGFQSLVTLSGERTVHRWQARSADSGPRVYEALRIRHADPVKAVAVRGRIIATASQDGHVRIWQKTALGSSSGFDHGKTRTHQVSGDGRFLALAGNGDVVLWDLATDRQYAVASELFGDQVAVLEHGARIVTWGYNAVPRLRDVASQKVIAELGKASAAVHAADDGAHFAVQSDTAQVTVWRDGQQVRALDFPAPVAGIRLSAQARYLVVMMAKHAASLRDVQTGRELASLNQIAPPDDVNTGGTQPVAFSPDERFLAVKEGTHAVLLETATGRRAQTLAHDAEIWSITFNASASRLLVRYRGGVALWETTGRRVGMWPEAGEAAFSRSGKYLYVSFENGSAQLIDASAGGITWSDKSAGAATHVAVADDEQPVVVTASDRTVTIRDLRDGGSVRSLEFDADIATMTFTSNGQALIVVREDGTDRIPIDVRALVTEARVRLEGLKGVSER